jgi:probable rRNA maturation factor
VSRRGPQVLVSSRAPRTGALARRLGALCTRYLVQLKRIDAELSLSLVTDVEIQEINARWRSKDQPTDVLSFPAGEQPLPPGALRPLGDVIISIDTARRRAKEDGRPLDSELARYLAHGVLHLLGHDHHRADEARRMARAERALLGAVGMVGAATARSPAAAGPSPRQRPSR